MSASVDELSFDSLSNLVNESSNDVWVRLYDGIRVCLTAVADSNTQLFVGKFVPCAHNAREYNIRYRTIKELVGERNGTDS